MTPHTQGVFKTNGYRVVHTETGGPGTGKTQRALEEAKRLEVEGKQVFVEEDEAASTVRVWVKI
jgi:hypothetical protein